MDYKSQDIQQIYRVSGETVRRWCTVFEKFLSPSANPGYRRQRLFNYEDMKVFALVSEMRSAGKLTEDILASLEVGQRGEFDALATADFDKQAMLQIDQLRARIAVLNSEVEHLQKHNRELAIQAGQSDYLKGELEKARQQIIELNRQIAVLEYRLNDG